MNSEYQTPPSRPSYIRALFQVSSAEIDDDCVAKFPVSSEIFARVLFSRNFAYAKFRENKILAKWQNHSVITDIGKSCPSRDFKRHKYVF